MCHRATWSVAVSPKPFRATSYCSWRYTAKDTDHAVRYTVPYGMVCVVWILNVRPHSSTSFSQLLGICRGWWFLDIPCLSIERPNSCKWAWCSFALLIIEYGSGYRYHCGTIWNVFSEKIRISLDCNFASPFVLLEKSINMLRLAEGLYSNLRQRRRALTCQKRFSLLMAIPIGHPPPWASIALLNLLLIDGNEGTCVLSWKCQHFFLPS